MMRSLVAFLCLPLLLPAAAGLSRRLSARLPAIVETGPLALFGEAPADTADPAGTVEFPYLTAGLFIGAGQGMPADASAVILFALFILALAVAATLDAEHGLIPDCLTLPLLLAGVAASALRLGWMNADSAVLGAAVGWGCYKAVQVILTRWAGRGDEPALGEGDVKLGAALGAWLGGVGGCLTLAVACGLLILRGLAAGHRHAAATPFGPYLFLAAGIIASANIYQIIPTAWL